MQYLHGLWAPGLGKSDLHYGDNSGYQAINLAYLRGATKIVLLGYDMQQTNGKHHYFGDHPKPLHNPLEYQKVAKHFDALAADLALEGVEVINCTRQTALKCFQRRSVEEL